MENVLADIPKKSPSSQASSLIRGGYNVKTYVTNKFRIGLVTLLISWHRNGDLTCQMRMFAMKSQYPLYRLLLSNCSLYNITLTLTKFPYRASRASFFLCAFDGSFDFSLSSLHSVLNSLFNLLPAAITS